MPEHIFSDFLHHLPSPEKKTKQIQMGGYSQSKDKDPNNNQDYFFTDPKHLSFGVFDGLNGIPGGQQASSRCSELVQQYLSEVSYSLPNFDDDGIEEILQNISNKVTSTIFELHQQNSAVMGCSTGLFGIIVPRANGTPKAFIVNIGDSRAYLIHHNVLHKETYEQNNISHPNQDRLDELSGKELSEFKKYYINENNKRITQFFGKQRVASVITKIDLEPKDVLLLVTDGIYHNLKKREISSISKINRHQNPRDISQEFINQAHLQSLNTKNSRSTPDDMTAVVVKIP